VNSNYPPGVTGNEPEIAGEDLDATMSGCDCKDYQESDSITLISAYHGTVGIPKIRNNPESGAIKLEKINFCPWCGSKLTPPTAENEEDAE
jgi:hypothetical protein